MTAVKRVALAAAIALAVGGGYVGVKTWVAHRPISDARYLEFAASRDHATVDTHGAPIVKGYVLEIFPAGAATPVQTIDLGKPNPSADGTIRIDLASLPITSLAPDATYEAEITAVGPYGRADSTRSNRFAWRRPR